MKQQRTLHITLTAAEVQKIVTDHVSDLMYNQDYELDLTTLSDNDFWPDVHFRGVHEDDKETLQTVLSDALKEHQS